MAVSTPTLPASTVAATNTSGQYVAVGISGGTVTAVTVNGVQVASGTGVNVSLPPGGTISVTYSVAPTWTWTDPLEEGYTPGYGQMNTGAEQGTYSQAGELPMAAHAMGGFTGLGVGVSN
jgi:hypothetical protein